MNMLSSMTYEYTIKQKNISMTSISSDFFSDSLDDVCALCGQENDDDVSLVDVVWVCRFL